jgi:hypothetical protein
MVRIKLRYDAGRWRKKYKIDSSIEEIKLTNKGITSIDLSVLSQCTRLRNIYLSQNKLTNIDLSPLDQCQSLWNLFIMSNQLEYIDLTPLSQCSSFSNLYLSSNQFTSIDLTPLSHCQKLRRVFLANNKLQNIDLTPLSNCPLIESLDFSHNQIETIDLTCLRSLRNLRAFLLDGNPVQRIDLTPILSSPVLEVVNIPMDTEMYASSYFKDSLPNSLVLLSTRIQWDDDIEPGEIPIIVTPEKEVSELIQNMSALDIRKFSDREISEIQTKKFSPTKSSNCRFEFLCLDFTNFSIRKFSNI